MTEYHQFFDKVSPLSYNWFILFREGAISLADNISAETERELHAQVEQLNSRLTKLDTRLDNIDSMVTAVAERVMSRPITLHVVCPHCNKGIEVSVIGVHKPSL